VTAPDWTAWRLDVFGDPYLVWHDGPDFVRLLDLAGTEPADVARMVAVGIDAGDPLAAQSIAALAGAGMAPAGAEALLRAAATGATEAFLVCVAQALHVLTGNESWAAPIASVLLSDAFWGVRIDAAIALAGFAPTVELVEILGQAVRGSDFLVRCHAANTLRRYAGRSRTIDQVPTLFAKISSPAEGEPTPGDLALWHEAAEKLTSDALRRLDQP
jgi:hypothetical protein